MWPALRDFLNVPEELTGKGVRIAIVDGDFPNHPDITTNPHRTTYKVMAMDPDPEPAVISQPVVGWIRSSTAATDPILPDSRSNDFSRPRRISSMELLRVFESTSLSETW